MFIVLSLNFAVSAFVLLQKLTTKKLAQYDLLIKLRIFFMLSEDILHYVTLRKGWKKYVAWTLLYGLWRVTKIKCVKIARLCVSQRRKMIYFEYIQQMLQKFFIEFTEIF